MIIYTFSQSSWLKINYKKEINCQSLCTWRKFRMDKVLKQIADGEFKHDPIPMKKPAFVFVSRKKITDE